MHDSATVSGTGAGTPTGNVTFTFFANGTCTGDGIGAGTVNLVSGVAHPSNPTGALTAGSYAFRATYNGDSNYNVSTSGCEPFTVNKADTTSVTTTPQRQPRRDPQRRVGAPRHDHARLRHRLRHRCGHPHRQRDLHLLRQRHL